VDRSWTRSRRASGWTDLEEVRLENTGISGSTTAHGQGRGLPRRPGGIEIVDAVEHDEGRGRYRAFAGWRQGRLGAEQRRGADAVLCGSQCMADKGGGGEEANWVFGS